MDFKRNYSSNTQQPTHIKTNHIVNPLVAIANASTPVRTRVVKPSGQLNSTPVNVHKIGIPAKSPVINKENDSGHNRLALKKPQITQQNLNLSPVMALNKKINEGPHLDHRSLTPNSLKRQQSLSQLIQRKDSLKNDHQIINNIHDSRRQNGFGTMVDSRAKTPIRNAFGQAYQQKQNIQFNSTVGLRTSNSSQVLLTNLSNTNKLKQSRNSKLMESRSFEQLINLKQDEILCSNSNEHQKKIKAKYKVVEQPEDEQILVYCSKCAINLVQKGFKVQDLTLDDINRIKGMQRGVNLQSSNHNQNQSNHNEYFQYASQTHRKIQIKLNQLRIQKQSFIQEYDREVQDVDCYYNSILTLVEQQKIKDRETIIKKRQKERKNIQTLQRKLSGAIGDLTHLQRNRVSHQHLNAIQQIQILLTEKASKSRQQGPKCLFQNIEKKFTQFTSRFQNESRLKIEDVEQEPYSDNYQNFTTISRGQKDRNDCPMRFSFEKTMRQTKKSPISYRGINMNTLMEAPEAMEGEDSGQMTYENEKKAFRTLFPQDDEAIEENPNRDQGIHSPTFKQI